MKHAAIAAVLASALLAAAWAQPRDGKALTCKFCCASKLKVCPHICPPCPSFRGQCPFVDKSVILCPAGPPKNLCKSDFSCSKGQRCCDTGCRRECSPVCRRPCRPGQKCLRKFVLCKKSPCPQPPPTCEGPVRRPGTCPINDILPVILCLPNAPDRCSQDSSCPDGQKCCSYGCARTCVPSCLPACTPAQECVLKRASPTTCLGGSCPGVSRCRPRNPCDMVRCRSGYRCVVRGKKAKCVPIPPRPGVCPVNDIITTCVVRKDACTSDVQCKSGQKCCSRGCGRACVPVCKRPCAKCRLVLVPEACTNSIPPSCSSSQRPVCLSVPCKKRCHPGMVCHRGRKGKSRCVKIYRG